MKLDADVRDFLKMAIDFGNMGTGEFIRNYPDCGNHEGYGYIERHARRMLNKREGGRG